MNTIEQYGNNIKALRKSKGLTQEEVAEKLGVTRQTISNYETGASPEGPTIKQLEDIAGILDTSIDKLLASQFEISDWKTHFEKGNGPKAVVNGKTYNTSTAYYIGNESYSNRGNFHYYDENLYRKESGEFFLHGEGGALSKYRIQVDTNSWSGSSKFIPLPDDEAKEWVERNCSTEEYIWLFGEPEE